MAKKISKKGEGFVQEHLITIILALIVIAVLLIIIFRVQILDYIRNLPGYSYEGDKEKEIGGEHEETSAACPVNVAKIVKSDKVYKCGDKACYESMLIGTNLLWKGSVIEAEIKVYQTTWGNDRLNLDEQIGGVSGGKISLSSEILAGYGKLFFTVKNELPDYEFLLNLNGARYGYNNIICRNEKISLEKVQRKIKKITVEGFNYYYDVSEIIRKKNTALVFLYADENLEKQAKSWISKDGNKVFRQPEEGEKRDYAIEVEVDLTEKSPEDINNYQNEKRVQELMNKEEGETGDIKLKQKIDNSNNQLGVYTNGDGFDHVYYKKINGRTYTKFGEFSLRNHFTPWILMDYWNENRNFRWAPEWAILK